MNFLEKDLEEIVFESDCDLICERGLPIDGKKLRQVRIGNYGIADLITYNKHSSDHIDISIYEFKKGVAGADAFFQAVRYMRGIDRYLKFREVSFCYTFDIVICGKEIETTTDYIYLCEYIAGHEVAGLNSLQNYKYDYRIDGIHFTKVEGYILVEEGFPIKDRINDILF